MLYYLTILLFSASLCSAAPLECEIEAKPFQESYRFQKFTRFIGAKLEVFQKEHMPKAESVFYPFGGPDLLHPLILFPDAKTYVLVGLETPGEAFSQRTLDVTFEKLDSLLRRGFFVTSAMSKSFNQKSGVRAALALQILLMGGKILEDSMLDPNTVSLSFEWNGQKKIAYYLKQNLIDNEDSLFAFLSTHGVSDVCMIKSSSYSLHNKVFSHLKDRILKTFPILVQDDTGVPFKDLAGYDVQLFGHYSTPYGVEFQCYQQNELKTRYETTDAIPPLNFCFGYGCGRVQASIMIARRANEGS